MNKPASTSKLRTIAPLLPKGGIRVDPPTAMLSLFHPRARNAQRLMCKSSVNYYGSIITAHYPELDQRDQGILFAILSHASKQGEPTVTTPGDGLNAEGKIVAWPTVDVTISIDDLIHAAGWTKHHAGQKTYKAVEASLIRLHQVVLSASIPDGTNGRRQTYITNLLSSSHSSAGQWTVRLCGRVAGALLGMHHIRLLMTERTALQTPSAQILHAWLSGWCRVNGTMRISLGKLCTHIWSDFGSSRKQMVQARKAIASINALKGWTIRIMGGHGVSQQILVRRA